MRRDTARRDAVGRRRRHARGGETLRSGLVLAGGRRLQGRGRQRLGRGSDGGEPRFVLASGGADSAETTLRCMEGVVEACEQFGVYPLGGDTTSSEKLVVDVAILGEAPEPVLRSGASPGDLLAVTGELGAAAAGLLALQRGVEGCARLVERHLRPEPRVAAGLAAVRPGAHAMIDLSDGLASDVRHVCERSEVGCRIELERLPVADDTRRFAASLGLDPEVLAATGGEDYELLIAAPGNVLETLDGELDVPLTIIGEVVDRTGEASFSRNGAVIGELSGWDHFV